MAYQDLKISTNEGIPILAVRVVPRAHRNEIADVLGDGRIKVRLVAPPVNGKANVALVSFLSELLEVPVGSVEIISGASGRDKLVSIAGVDANYLHRRIAGSLGRVRKQQIG